MAETSIDLPEDCWAMIFNLGSDWESLSLVCKRFLSITNTIQVSLSVSNPSNQVLCKLLRRFPNLQEVELMNFQGDLNKAILAISQFGLNPEELILSHNRSLPTVCLEEVGSNMRDLNVLKCSHSNLTGSELFRIANSFPQLEELEIRCSPFPREINDQIISLTDEGFEFLSTKLKRFCNIDISMNGISDKSLIYLSSNSEFLEKIVVGYSDGVTEKGISFVIQNTDRLNSFLFKHFKIGSFGSKGCANFPKNLQSLSFFCMEISDDFLYSITKACIPLKDFTLSSCTGYTVAGISSFLNSSHSLKSLDLSGAEFLTDEHIEKFSRFLHNLTSIRLHSCPKLSDSSFVMLTQRCHLLTHISMEKTGLGKEEYNYDSLTKKLAIKSLSLSENQYLNSSVLRRILNYCPNVDELTLRECFQRDQKLDVADILEFSRVIVCLTLDGSKNLNFCRKDIEISKLRTLMASDSEINDEVLTMIGRNCPGLMYLELENCRNLTEKGVKEVVKSCERLIYLSLRGCSNVTFDIIEWIVSTRPSLGRLNAPPYPEEEDEKHNWIVHTNSVEKYLLLDGCEVCRD